MCAGYLYEPKGPVCCGVGGRRGARRRSAQQLPSRRIAIISYIIIYTERVYNCCTLRNSYLKKKEGGGQNPEREIIIIQTIIQKPLQRCFRQGASRSTHSLHTQSTSAKKNKLLSSYRLTILLYY